MNEAIWLTALAREPVTSGTWNLLMLWMKDRFEGRGFGKAIVSEVDTIFKERQARLLIVETSQLPEFATARKRYENYGVKLEAEVKNFFDAGDNKLIYSKPVVGS